MSKHDLDVLETLGGKIIAFNRLYVEMTGSITAALMFSQAVYWQRIKRGEWWWKTQAEWFEECGLSRRELETARKVLVSIGLLEHERRGLPGRSFYRVNVSRLKDLLPRESSMAESANQECGNSAQRTEHNGGMRQSASAECANHLKTSEITSEITSEKKDITRKREPRKTFLPEDFAISPSMRSWAQEKRLQVDLDREHERFINHHIAKANKYADWERAWKNWMSGAFVSKKPGAPAPRHRGLVL